MDEQNEKYPHTHSGLTSRGRFFLIALFLLIAAVFVGGCDGIYTLRDYLYDRAFIPVADITGIPAVAVMGPPLTLAPVIVPGDATNRAVAWSVSDPGATGAAITGGVFTAAAEGMAKITARVADGLWKGKDFVKAFTIAVQVVSIDVAMTATTSGTLWSYDSGTKVITIEDGADVTLMGVTSENRVAVAPGATATVTLQDVTINVSETANAAFDLGDGAAVTLLLSGTNALTSGGSAAGLHVTEGRTLVIDSAASSHAETGSLTVTGGSADGAGAGIGGGMSEPGGAITIAGGAVTAHGAAGGGAWAGGAGIGGGGELDAIGYFSGANHAGTILISGGIVTAIGGDYTAGIGGGAYANSAPGSVTISGGIVTATGGGSKAAGIGGSARSNGGTITITGGTVTAQGGDWGAGIGGGEFGAGGTITISGGTVTAQGGYWGAGIGGGGYGYGGTITISGGTVNATCDRYGAGIGGGADGSGGTINIAGSAVVTATGAGGGAGIGSGYSRTSGNAAGQKTGGYITIGGNAVVFAQGGNAQGPGASIGGSGWANSDQWEGDSAGVIVIKENAVVAAPQGIRSSGEGGPGPRSITISGGTVIAGGIGLGVDTVNFAESPANAVALTSAVLDSGTYADEFPVTGALLLGSAVSISFTGTVGNTATAGTVTLNAPLTIPEGATLRAPPGWTLVTNGYLVNNGTVIQSAGAAITGGVSGSVTVE